jgi:hypothetical protein
MATGSVEISLVNGPGEAEWFLHGELQASAWVREDDGRVTWVIFQSAQLEEYAEGTVDDLETAKVAVNALLAHKIRCEQK